MKKIMKLIVSFILFMTLSSSCFAQGYPVLDIANLLNSIEELYATYQEITNMIEQVQNTYQQIEQAAKQMASTDWEAMAKDFGNNMNGIWTYGEFNINDPIQSITKVKQSANEITKLVDQNMNKVNRIQAALQDERIQFGDMKVSVADLCFMGDPDKDILDFSNNAGTHIVDTAKNMAKGYTEGLTYKEKQAIVKKYGMSAENYAQLRLINYNLDKFVTEGSILGSTTALKSDLTEAMAKNNSMKEIAEKLPDGSIYAATKLTNTYLAETNMAVDRLAIKVGKFFGGISEKIKAEKAEELMKKQTEQELLDFIEENTSAPAFVDDDE